MEFPVVSSVPFVLFGCVPRSIRPIFVANPFVARERDAQHLLGPRARPCRLLMCQNDAVDGWDHRKCLTILLVELWVGEGNKV